MTNLLPGEDNSMRFSLFQAWCQNKQKAMEKYFPEVETTRITTKWMEAGSHVAASLEERPLPWWLSDMTPADISEYRIIEEFDGFRVRGTLDKFQEDKNTVIDNKTLKRKMTAKEEKEMNEKVTYTLEDFTSLKSMFDEKDAKKHKKQLAFYQVLVQERHGHVDPEAYIEVIPVIQDINGLIRRTGEPAHMVLVEITDKDREEMKQLMIDTVKDVSICFDAYKRGDIKL